MTSDSDGVLISVLLVVGLLIIIAICMHIEKAGKLKKHQKFIKENGSKYPYLKLFKKEGASDRRSLQLAIYADISGIMEELPYGASFSSVISIFNQYYIDAENPEDFDATVDVYFPLLHENIENPVYWILIIDDMMKFGEEHGLISRSKAKIYRGAIRVMYDQDLEERTKKYRNKKRS